MPVTQPVCHRLGLKLARVCYFHRKLSDLHVTKCLLIQAFKYTDSGVDVFQCRDAVDQLMQSQLV